MLESRDWMDWIGFARVVRAWLRRALCALAVVGLSLVLAPTVAGATLPAFTWSGEAAESSWSAVKNWEGETTPSGPGPVSLDFPRIPSCTGSCYKSTNDVSGLNVESIGIDDGDEYELKGDEITLGGGGIAVSPASGTSGPAGDIFGLPIELGAPQTWNLAGRSGGAVGENGMLLKGGVTGSGEALTVDMSNAPILYLERDTEIGSMAINGTGAGAAGGVVSLDGSINAEDGDAVSMNHIAFEGLGAVGAVKTSSAELFPGDTLAAASLTLDAASKMIFAVLGSPVPGGGYSQLTSHGAIDLGDSSLDLLMPKTSCPVVKAGQVFTLISTTGTLSGSFGNAGEGKKIPIEYPQGCLDLYQALEIHYHESGATQTVTATVMDTGGAALPLPVNSWNTYEREDDPVEWGAISAAQDVAEAQEQKKREAEAEARARAAAEAATGEVSLAGTSLTVQSDGMAIVKLSCKGGGGCGGKLTLSAQVTPKAKGTRKHVLTLGTAQFSIAVGKTATIRVKLDAAGRALLDHGRLVAHLTVLELAPSPGHSQTANVDLIWQRPHHMAKK